MSAHAADILKQVRERYAACRSYRDDGVVTTTMRHADPSRNSTTQRPFSTRLVRDHAFRFEFRSRFEFRDKVVGPWKQYVIWTENGSSRSWWSLKPHVVEEDRPLLTELGAAAGVSGRSSWRIPILLMPELCDQQEHRINERVIEASEADAMGCCVIEITTKGHTQNRIEQIWINRTEFLIRRVVEPPWEMNIRYDVAQAARDANRVPEEHRQKFMQAMQEMSQESVHVESVTTYEAAFDIEIGEGELGFVPPQDETEGGLGK